MPTPSIQFPPSQSPVKTAVQADPQSAQNSAPSAPGAVLGGPGVRVSVSGSQLDKLVAKVKNESDDTRLESAKLRIAIVLTMLSSLNVQLSEGQKNAFAQIEVLQSQLADLAKELAEAESDLEAADAATAALAAKTKELEAAVARAIKDGEEHRKQVDELKKTRAADDAELKAAEAALAKSEAAIAAAQANLSKARGELDASKAKSEGIKKNIASLKSQIASANKAISDCIAAIGDTALQTAAAALRTTAPDIDPADRETNADREKEEAKVIANDPLRVIRDALDRMDADVRRTIEENRTTLV